MELSSYQERIFTFFRDHPNDNMLINALAGSGKSSTACLLLESTDAYSVYVAFNKSIADEFKQRIKNPKVKIYTLHGLALAIMNYNLKELYGTELQLDNLKMYKIFDLIGAQFFRVDPVGHKEEMDFYRANFVKLFDLCRMTLTDFEDQDKIEQIIEDHGLFETRADDYFEAPPISICPKVLKEMWIISLDQFSHLYNVDFTDLLYITRIKVNNKEWKMPFWGCFQNVVIDEQQDTDRLQQHFSFLIKRKNGRFVIIQDENQAIYYFKGSDANAYKNAKKLYAPITEFDLPICYRCPSSHLELVNELFEIPIQARPGAPRGTIKIIDKENIKNYAKAGDMIIARRVKWLGGVVLQLAKAGVPVYIGDKEMAATVKKYATKTKAKTTKGMVSELERDLKDARDKLKERRKKKQPPKQFPGVEDPTKLDATDIQNFTYTEENSVIEVEPTSNKTDNLEFLLEILRSYVNKNPSNSKESFIKYLDKLLNTDPTGKGVRLCSVHKSKGLEAQNVFVMNEGKICHDFRNSREQAIQEKNLSYISMTRAKNALYLVRSDEKKNREYD